jgi:hypothetical protein
LFPFFDFCDILDLPFPVYLFSAPCLLDPICLLDIQLTNTITFQVMIYLPVVSSNASVHTFSHGAISYIHISCNSFSLHLPAHGFLDRSRSDTEVDPHSHSLSYLVNSRHDFKFAILTWHERGNALPAMNKTFSGGKTKATRVPMKSADSKRLSLESFSTMIRQKDPQFEKT